jgi:hypothetical protein
MFFAALAGLLMLISAVNVHAQPMIFFRGMQLKDRLAQVTSGSAAQYNMGLGYVLGVHDVLANNSVCSPPHTTTGQVADIVYKYLVDHPEKLHEHARDLVRNALSSAFPCRK